jgi:hypothetical protein
MFISFSHVRCHKHSEEARCILLPDGPPPGPSLIANEIKDTVCRDRGIQQEGGQVSVVAGLAESAEKQMHLLVE